MQTDLVNVNFVTNINKSLKMLLATNLLKSFVQCIFASINGYNDTVMDNSNTAMLSIIVEPRNWITALHNNYHLTSYSITHRDIT